MNKLWSTMANRATPYIPGEQLNQADLLKLNTNENPYPPSEKVIKAIQTAADEKLRLYPSPTSDSLRETIAKEYSLKRENVFVGNGSDEVLAFSFMAFFDPEHAILFPDITYSFYPVYANLFNIPYQTVPLTNTFTINPEAYFNSDGGVIFPNPNAPTGMYLALKALERIIQHNQDQVVIVDEAYIDFAPESAVRLTKKYDNLLVIQTLSKSRALAGLRIGFALGNEHLIQALIRIKDSVNSYPIDRLAMAGASAALLDKAYFNYTTKQIISTRKWVTEALTEKGFDVLPSAANFVFVTHPGYNAEQLYTDLRKQNILIRHFNHDSIQQYLRISIGTDEEMKQFIEVLTAIMEQ